MLFSHKAAEPFFTGIPNLRLGHFNKLRGQDVYGDVRHLFVLGRPFASPEQTRVIGMALHGEPLPAEQPQLCGQYVHMRDGSQRIITVLHYDNPTLEAVRAAITDAEIIQVIGRGRGVNREADNPLIVWLLTDVAVRWPLDILLTWGELALTPRQRMEARGLVLDNSTDAARVYLV